MFKELDIPGLSWDEHDEWEDTPDTWTKDEKSKRLDHSRPFDVHRWSDHPEVNQFVTEIYVQHFAGRKRKIRLKHIKVLLLDLYCAWNEDPLLKVSISRNKSDYWVGTRYNELNISSLTIKILDTLVAQGLVNQIKGFRDRKAGIGRTTRIWPTKKLASMFERVRFSQFDIGSHKDRLNIILRSGDEIDGDTTDIEYEATPEVQRMAELVTKYNQLLASTFIDIPELENSVVQGYGNSPKCTFSISQVDKFTRRIFNRGSFKLGGRFWGGWWQRCPKEYREKIFINDTPTHEIDFSALHPVLLYAQEGVNYWKENGEDVYELGEFDFLKDGGERRSVTKSLMLMLLNAENSKSAYKAFRQDHIGDGNWSRYTDEQLSTVQEALSDRHPLISKHFGADMGIHLMNKDAQIAEKVLNYFVIHEIPILTLHDSFIVPAGYEEELKEQMCSSFEEVTGLSLSGVEDLAVKGLPKKEDMPDGGFNEQSYDFRSIRYQEQWGDFMKWKRSRDNINT